jgi:hypothetical protein
VADWYRPHETERAHALYDNVRAWGGDRRDVTVIGGVAVHELVRPAVRMRSRDLDLVLHSNAALASFEGQFARWGIAWRRHGRNTFKECRFVDAEAFPPVIDVFTTDAEVGAARFGLHKGRNVLAEVQGQGFLPTLPKLLQLKVRAVEARQGAEAGDKRAKDLVDVYHLVFENVQFVPPLALHAHVPRRDREAAAAHLGAARRLRPLFARQYTTLERWLLHP